LRSWPETDHERSKLPASGATTLRTVPNPADVPFWRDHGIDGVGVRCGHSVVQFGAAITRARDRFARERV
jgi:hypothetical protein